MLFTAVIRPGSTIDRMWAGHNRRAGVVNGVQFNKQGSLFVSDELAPEQYAALQFHPCVQVDVRTSAPSVPLVDDTPVDAGLVPPEFRLKSTVKSKRK